MSTDTTTTTTQSDVPIACIPDALTAEQQERWMEVGPQLYAAVQEVQELPDGYAFRLPSDAAMLLLVAEDLNFERLCCPFLRFTLDIAPNGAPFWLHFTGGEGVKEFLRLNFEQTNVLNEQVAQAAGFSITDRIDINSVETALETVNMINEQFAMAAGVRTQTEN
jgi:hypothetical protein